MKIDDLYHGAHIYIAAVRVFNHLHNNQPTAEDVSNQLKISLEQSHFLCKKLKELDIVETVEGAFGDRIFIKDHLRIEEIPRNVKVNSMEDEIRKFQDSRKGLAEKVESIKSAQDQKRKTLFEEMEKKLKEQMKKK